eukprot:Pgem_evm1s435
MSRYANLTEAAKEALLDSPETFFGRYGSLYMKSYSLGCGARGYVSEDVANAVNKNAVDGSLHANADITLGAKKDTPPAADPPAADRRRRETKNKKQRRTLSAKTKFNWDKEKKSNQNNYIGNLGYWGIGSSATLATSAADFKQTAILNLAANCQHSSAVVVTVTIANWLDHPAIIEIVENNKIDKEPFYNVAPGKFEFREYTRARKELIDIQKKIENCDNDIGHKHQCFIGDVGSKQLAKVKQLIQFDDELTGNIILQTPTYFADFVDKVDQVKKVMKNNLDSPDAFRVVLSNQVLKLDGIRQTATKQIFCRDFKEPVPAQPGMKVQLKLPANFVGGFYTISYSYGKSKQIKISQANINADLPNNVQGN